MTGANMTQENWAKLEGGARYVELKLPNIQQVEKLEPQKSSRSRLYQKKSTSPHKSKRSLLNNDLVDLQSRNDGPLLQVTSHTSIFKKLQEVKQEKQPRQVRPKPTQTSVGTGYLANQASLPSLTANTQTQANTQMRISTLQE